ncbi:hypothetical protein Tco_0651444 [Tanacetum coccineum]|uniref:Uncharacterized protein n=1 Tax=Tanacetum coccineum TaxID=301880 RepID=A0ABQ4WUY0_9ASTR
MAAFKVLETQFYKFIKSQTYLDDEYVVMTRKYFLEYTQLEIREFRSDSEPIYDEELMAEVQLIADPYVFVIRTTYTEQPEFNNEGEVDQNAEQCHDTCPLSAKLTDNQTTELSNQSLESKNICLHVVHEKTMTPRSCLRWKPTGKVFNSVGLRWVPTGKIFTSSTTTVDSEPPHGSNTDITNLYECTPFNLKKERIKVWIKENVISGRPRLHWIALIQEIYARQNSQGIRKHFRVILFSIHSDDGNPSRVNIKQLCYSLHPLKELCPQSELRTSPRVPANLNQW